MIKSQVIIDSLSAQDILGVDMNAFISDTGEFLPLMWENYIKEKAGPKDKPKEAKVYDGEETFNSRDHKYDKDPTGLAIEIFNTTWDKDAGINPTEVMDVCIGLVKQAQEAFK